MSWGRVGRIYVVLALLGAWVWLFERAPVDVNPKHQAPPAAESLLEVEPEAVVAMTFRRGGDEVHAVSDGGRWQVLRPQAANVSADLLAALAGTLTAGQAAEELTSASEGSLADFGLVDPTFEIEVTLRDRSPAVLVQIGTPNPTGTAVYAKRSDRDTIFLIGLNVRYYTDLVFDSAG